MSAIINRILGRNKPNIQGIRIIDTSIDNYLTDRFSIDLHGMDTSEMTGTLNGVLRKAKLPNWYTKSPYGHPRTDDMETLRNLAQMGIVQRCIRLYIQKIKATPWTVKAKDATDDSPATKERIREATDWFKNASSNETSYFQELEKALWDYFELGEGVLVKMFLGSAYTEVQGQNVVLNDSKPGDMVYCQSFDVSQFQVLATDHNNILGHWQFNFVKSPPQFFSPRELIVFQDQPANYRFYGRPRIASILQFLEMIASQTLQMRNFYKKGGILQGVITTSGASSSEEKKIEKFFKEKFRSMEHKLALLQGGKDFKVEFLPLMLNIKDLAFLEGFDFVQKFVMSVFDIQPEELLGSENSKAGVAESSRKQRSRIRAMLNDLEFATNKEIMREIDKVGDLIFEYEKDTDPEVLKIIQETDASKIDRGQITLNEWRKKNGEEPYPDERANQPTPFLVMDNASQNAQLMQAIQEPRGMEGREDSDTEPETDTEDDNAEEPGKGENEPIKKPPNKKKDLDKDILKELSDAQLDAKLDKLLNKLSRKMQIKLVEVFKDWETKANSINLMVLDDFKIIKNVVDKIIVQEELTKAITDSMFQAFQTGLSLDNFEVIADSPIFSLPDRRTLDYFRTYPLLVSQRVTSRISQNLSIQLFEGMTRGEDIPTLSKRVTSVMTNLKTWEAERIARTETANAMVWGQINNMRQNGLEQWEFYATMDERTCPICAPLHEKRFSLDDLEFKPPLHPNCRCTVLNVIPEEIGRSLGWFASEKMGEIEFEAGESIVKILRDRMALNHSTREIAKDFNTTHQTVNNWINKFELRKSL